MNDDIIKKLITQLEEKANELKEIHNALKLVQKVSPIPFDVPEIHALFNGREASGEVIVTSDIKPDTFYGMEHTLAAEKYLNMVGHAVPFDEIYRAMLRGGLDIEGEEQMRKFNTSLTRANQKFKKFGSGLNVPFGLLSWYEKSKKTKVYTKTPGIENKGEEIKKEVTKKEELNKENKEEKGE